MNTSDFQTPLKSKSNQTNSPNSPSSYRNDPIIIRTLLPGEEFLAAQLIRDCFMRFLRSDCTHEGAKAFLDWNTPESIKNRIAPERFEMFVAVDTSKVPASNMTSSDVVNENVNIESQSQGQIMGLMEVRTNNHISLLFVNKDYHRRGVGKRLFLKAVEVCKQKNRFLDEIHLNSSRFAVKIYQKLGFVKMAGEKMEDGIKTTPMKYVIVKRRSPKAEKKKLKRKLKKLANSPNNSPSISPVKI